MDTQNSPVRTTLALVGSSAYSALLAKTSLISEVYRVTPIGAAFALEAREKQTMQLVNTIGSMARLTACCPSTMLLVEMAAKSKIHSLTVGTAFMAFKDVTATQGQNP